MDEIEVDVFICTYNRSSLIDAVNSVLEQKLKNIRFIVHVIDNDEEKSALQLVRVHPQVRYHHAPKRNISIARNKALDVATREYLAFMDDDQVASPDWLANLAQTQQSKNADIVLGPVLARYPDKTADWIKNGDFFSTRPSYKNNHRIETGYTGNVLIRRSTVGNTRFREELGQSGGEDTIFFHELYQKGATFAFSQDALMTEHIDLNRLRISWLMRRNIRNGQTYARILRQSGTTHAIAIITALAKIAYSFTSSIICMTSPVAWRRNLLRGMFHFGVLTNFFGKTDLQNY
jgi:succinoglycan biosynthesis protein ExoM